MYHAKRLIPTVGSTGDSKHIVPMGTNPSQPIIASGDSRNREWGRWVDSIYTYDGEGKSPESIPKNRFLSKTTSDDDKERPVRMQLADGEERETNAIHGMISLIGRQREMREAVSVAVGEFPSYDLFGVYDSPRLAKLCRRWLRRLVAEEIRKSTGGRKGGAVAVDWFKMMKTCFSGMKDGGAAAAVVVGKYEVVVSGCGSGLNVVLCQCGNVLPLRHDHKSEADEEEDPTVRIHRRTEKDEFIVIASNGLWDVISEEVTCQLVKRCLSGYPRKQLLDRCNRESPVAQAAALLTELAMARGTKDNISVIVVELNKSTCL